MFHVEHFKPLPLKIHLCSTWNKVNTQSKKISLIPYIPISHVSFLAGYLSHNLYRFIINQIKLYNVLSTSVCGLCYQPNKKHISATFKGGFFLIPLRVVRYPYSYTDIFLTRSECAICQRTKQNRE